MSSYKQLVQGDRRIRWLAKTFSRQKLVGSISTGNEIAGRNARNTSKSACFSTSSALILFKMNSASFATLTMWSFIAWDSSLCNVRKYFHEGKREYLILFCLRAFSSHIINVLPSLVNELDESEARVLLQGVLPFLRAEQHNQFHDGVAVLKCG